VAHRAATEIRIEPMETNRLTRPRVWALAALAACLALGGCKDEMKELSSAERLLSRQHKAWNNAREALETDQPNLESIRVVSMLLTGQTKRQLKKKYRGADKAEIIERLDALSAAFQERIAPKVDLRAPKVVLRENVTMEQLREAFNSLDEDYRALEAMTD
jgi:hypothetical protein